MTNLEKMKELLNLPVEEFAEKITQAAFCCPTENVCGLEDMFCNERDDAGAECCLDHYSTDSETLCPYLDDYYDPECSFLYGSCRLHKDKSCPFGVDRRQILKDSIIQRLTAEYKE